MSLDTFSGILLAVSLTGWIWTRYSIWSLPVLLALSLLAEDDHYPLSWYPMYSDPDESENYLYVATYDDDPAKNHDPLKVRSITGITAPKVKKMFKSWAEDYAKKELGKKDRKALTAEERDVVGQRLLNYFRELAEKRNQSLPEKLVLVEVWIEAEKEKGYIETLGIIARQPSTP